MFNTYLELGINHILDIEGYDHILFIIALCAVFGIKDWKKILILATAFTIGHSITLAMAALDMVKFPAKVIEVLIPVTIIITAITNILRSSRKEGEDFPKWNYYLPLFFGLIHGLGFSTFFRALMGKSSEVILPLFAFNVGVELGQIVIIAITMVLSFLLVNLAGLKRNYWNLAVSILAIVVSCYLIYEKI